MIKMLCLIIVHWWALYMLASLADYNHDGTHKNARAY